MPLASMVTGTVVTSALSDQIDDNLASLFEGVWFRATRSTSLAMSSGGPTAIALDTLALSDTATDGSYVSLASGNVQTRLTGHWFVGGSFSFSVTGTAIQVLVDATDSVAGGVAETYVDTGSNKDNLCASAVVNVTSATNVFALYGFAVTGPTINATGPPATLWGVYLGDV
jgi:hypothetical protein